MQNGRRTVRGRLVQGRKRLQEIILDIFDMLDPDREPDMVLRYAGGESLRIRELLVSGRPRMDDSGFGISQAVASWLLVQGMGGRT
jgi:hypothetical protein